MNTLLLDRTTWDLLTDLDGNIALAQAPYAVAQDVASAVKLFRGELYYNTLPGIPYFETILGLMPPVGYLKSQFVAAALTVPGVTAAICYISSLAGRDVQGQVQVTDREGVTSVVSLSPGPGANIGVL